MHHKFFVSWIPTHHIFTEDSFQKILSGLEKFSKGSKFDRSKYSLSGFNLKGKLLDVSLEKGQRRKIAYDLIEKTLQRFIEDKKARLRFGTIDTAIVDYRLVQILYRLYDELITIIVATKGLVDNEITEKLRELVSRIADIFNKLTYDISDQDKISIFESLKRHYKNEYGKSTFPKTLEELEKNQIIPLLKEIEKQMQ